MNAKMRRVACMLAVGLVTIGAIAPSANAALSPVTVARIPVVPPNPATFTHIPVRTSQVIAVTANSWRSTWALLTAWQRTPEAGWTLVASTPARVGTRGMRLAAARRQGTATTPAGTFVLGSAFGNFPAPVGTKMPFRQVGADDYWVYDPRDPTTYNRFVTGHPAGSPWRTSWAEHLAGYGSQYGHAVVIDYNHAVTPGTTNTAAGGGIFLHMFGKGSTAGCISIAPAVMTQIMAWLDPAASPTIVIGPASQITKM